MNGIAMMFQQVKQPVTTMQNNQLGKHTSADNQSIFQGLLLSEQQTVKEIDHKEIPVTVDELVALMNRLPSANGQLIDMLKGSEQVKNLLNGVTSMDEALRKLEELLSNLSIEQEKDAVQTNAINTISLGKDLLVKPTISNDAGFQKQVAVLFKQVEEALTQISNQQNVPKAAASLLKLLEQWTTFEKSMGKNVMNSIESLKNPEQQKVQAVWRELVQAYQKRNQFVVSQQYNTNAKVTSTDITKWVQNTLNNQAQFDKAVGQQGISLSTMPMSRLEQYVIYVNQSNSAQPVDQQLIEQFQKVMKTSKFLALNNGNSQLSIALRPENLGEMMVKLTQINGEMTVKIMVTSHAAKEMLESNMHQLKNMFSPQQVIVEKQDIQTQQTQNYQSEQDDQSWNDGDHEQSHHSDDDNKNDPSEEDFQTQFKELLMNEKV